MLVLDPSPRILFCLAWEWQRLDARQRAILADLLLMQGCALYFGCFRVMCYLLLGP
jgi:hypothetical protein